MKVTAYSLEKRCISNETYQLFYWTLIRENGVLKWTSDLESSSAVSPAYRENNNFLGEYETYLPQTIPFSPEHFNAQ